MVNSNAKGHDLKQKESDLFEPLRVYFEKQGFKVNGEVGCCDLLAKKSEYLLAVEMKLSLNLEVILQAADRQKIVDSVYIATTRPKGKIAIKRSDKVKQLLKRLEIGLIYVYFDAGKPHIEVIHEAIPYDREKSRQHYKAKRMKYEKELEKRVTLVKGGVTRTKLVTSYKEEAIRIALKLEMMGEASPKQLADENLSNVKIQSILSKNYYGWFRKIGKGIYTLSEQWEAQKKDYAYIAL